MQDDNVRHMCVLQRVELLQVAAVAVLLKLGEGIRDTQVECVTVSFGLHDVVVAQLQPHAAQEAVRLHHQQTDAFFPAQSGERGQLMLGQIRRDN